jgi:hypothetical protein
MADVVEEQATADVDTGEERADGHLDAVDAGAGCAEVWEHLSERRGADSQAAESD